LRRRDEDDHPTRMMSHPAPQGRAPLRPPFAAAFSEPVVPGHPAPQGRAPLRRVQRAGPSGPGTDAAPADNLIRAGQAACSYSCKIPPRRSRLRMSRRAILSGSSIGGGNGWSGRAFDTPWCGLWQLLRHEVARCERAREGGSTYVEDVAPGCVRPCPHRGVRGRFLIGRVRSPRESPRTVVPAMTVTGEGKDPAPA
jgi:hypothetical protein